MPPNHSANDARHGRIGGGLSPPRLVFRYTSWYSGSEHSGRLGRHVPSIYKTSRDETSATDSCTFRPCRYVGDDSRRGRQKRSEVAGLVAVCGEESRKAVILRIPASELTRRKKQVRRMCIACDYFRSADRARAPSPPLQKREAAAVWRLLLVLGMRRTKQAVRDVSDRLQAQRVGDGDRTLSKRPVALTVRMNKGCRKYR
ncbi:hypothetical protein VTK73DRAFT_1490 [Phialemonium thermophilum]|uniref:Uncharacterized protein n=1 Tax=Phialemonium thermophilum TaxID=223376 RepID=A0ABR3X942_9PEZI